MWKTRFESRFAYELQDREKLASALQFSRLPHQKSSMKSSIRQETDSLDFMRSRSCRHGMVAACHCLSAKSQHAPSTPFLQSSC